MSHFRAVVRHRQRVWADEASRRHTRPSAQRRRLPWTHGVRVMPDALRQGGHRRVGHRHETGDRAAAVGWTSLRMTAVRTNLRPDQLPTSLSTRGDQADPGRFRGP